MPASFTVSVEPHGDGTVVVRARGELDGATRHLLLAKTVAALSESPARIELDLAAVRFIDCMGLGALVSLRNHANDRNRTLVVSEPSPAVARLLSLTGLTGLLHDDRPESNNPLPATRADRCDSWPAIEGPCGANRLDRTGTAWGAVGLPSPPWLTWS